MICFVNFGLAAKYFSMQRKALSIRDILNIIDFIKVSTRVNPHTTHALDYGVAFRNAIELVIIDGVCLGIDTAGEAEKQKITSDCKEYLEYLISQIFGQIEPTADSYICTVAQIGVTPFVIKREQQSHTAS